MGPRRSVSIIFVFVALLSLAAALHASQASCSFTTFSVPAQYTLNDVEGISDDGTVVGQLIVNKTQALVGFMRSPSGDITVYSAPKSSTTWMYGENATGTNSGTYLDTSHKMHGFTLVNNSFSAVNYPNASSTWVFGVNHLGDLVGSYSGSGGTTKGFLLVNGRYTSLGDPGQTVTYPMAVNDNDSVVGYGASGWVSYGFLWQNGKFTTISSTKGKYGTVLTGINNAGLIVGNYVYADHMGGFIYTNGVFKTISYPGANFASTGGINNNGLISGQLTLPGNVLEGFTATCK